ncbi:MAG: hypothetical protein SGPRY_013034 [Prymnesium sp.]
MDESTASIFGPHGDRVHVSSLLADQKEAERLKAQISALIDGSEPCNFVTLNLVFSVPRADALPPSNRKPFGGVTKSPQEAIHASGECELCCFTHIQLTSRDRVELTALEYSRPHREQFLMQEFGSWLLEDHIEKAVIACSVSGEVCFWNRYATALYQYAKEEAMGENIMDLTPSDITQETAIQIMDNLSKGEHWRGMFNVNRKDKTNFMAHVSDTPIMSNGEVKFIVGVSDDYSQLHNVMSELESLNANLEKEVEARAALLMERERDLRLVGEAMKESDTGVIMLDRLGVVAWLNDVVAEMLGMSREALLGTFAWDLPVETEAAHLEGSTGAFYQLAKSVMGSEKTEVFHVVVTTAGHAPTVIALTFQAISGGDRNSCPHIMVTLRDLTVQRKADEAQRQAEKAMLVSQSRSEMLQMLSHELRTPLQGIMGVSSTLLVDMAPGLDLNLYDGVSAILASSRLLLTLINNILDMRKMDVNMMGDIEVVPVPVASSIRDAITFCTPFATINDVSIVDAIDETLERESTEVLANRLRLEQVMVNLVSNAVKYNAGGRVEISALRCAMSDALQEAMRASASDSPPLVYDGELANATNDDFAVVISVRDHGHGCPEAECHKLFGEFMQLSNASTKDKAYHGGNKRLQAQSAGSGLGLNLAKNLITRMKGHIYFNNHPEGGAVFSFFLPSAELVSPGTERPPTLKLESLVLSPHDATRFKVLLVDDNMINLFALQAMLERIGVLDIQTASNGLQALDHLESVAFNESAMPNLILCDLQMPEIDGHEFIRQVRMMKFTQNKTVLACTADWSPEVKQDCLASGFNGVMRKPIVYADLESLLASEANIVNATNAC